MEIISNGGLGLVTASVVFRDGESSVLVLVLELSKLALADFGFLLFCNA